MFHAVHIRHHGKHVGYEIYHNNKPVVRIRDVRLKRHEAFTLVRRWNFG